MPLPKTSGQQAYALWRESCDHYRETEPWIRLRKIDQDLWEKIANIALVEYKTNNVVIPHPEQCE